MILVKAVFVLVRTLGTILELLFITKTGRAQHLRSLKEIITSFEKRWNFFFVR